jgi:hypothetical protein
MRNIALLFLLLIALPIHACSSPTAPAELAPVFVVMCADPDPEEPHVPCCTGFAQGSQVVTANHCVLGDTAELVSNRQWLDTSNASQIGTVARRDEARDIAWLTAELDGPGLEQGAPVAQDDAVRALTRSGVRPGIVGNRTGLVWQSTIDTRFGDCGSAVIDQSGDAVGMVFGCLTTSGKGCAPHSARFVDLPR